MKEDIESIEKVVDELKDLLEYGFPYSDFYNIEYTLDKIKKYIKNREDRIKELEEENIGLRNQIKNILYDEM